MVTPAAYGVSTTTSNKNFHGDTLKKSRLRREANGSAANDKGIFYKDVALIRYTDGSVQVVNDTGFMNTFLKRANDEYWKTVSSI